MSSFLILYGTGEGQTTKIAEQIATTIGERGHEARPLVLVSQVQNPSGPASDPECAG